MQSIKKNSILIIFLSAVLLVVLYNFRWLNFYVEHMGQDVVASEHSRRFQGMVRVGTFNLIVEFIVFLVVSFFNYSWIDRYNRNVSSRKWKLAITITGNLALLFTFLPIQKFLHELLLDFKKHGFPETYYLVLNLSVFILAIVLVNFLKLYQRNKVSEIENIRLKEEKVRAELAALKEQISPHFFFNTLSTLSTIVRNEPREQGLNFIQDMSNTYRYAISSGKKDLVTLREELDFLDSYVFLIKKRFGNKLQIDIDIRDEYLDRQLPPMSIQLLVENAIQHNVITQVKPLTIRIFAENEKVVVQNTLQEKETQEGGFGLGLQNLATRFQLLSDREIFIERSADSFTVKLPLL